MPPPPTPPPGHAPLPPPVRPTPLTGRRVPRRVLHRPALLACRDQSESDATEHKSREEACDARRRESVARANVIGWFFVVLVLKSCDWLSFFRR